MMLQKFLLLCILVVVFFVETLSSSHTNSAEEVLFEINPRNANNVLDGRKVTVVAFVNPELPRSLSFHSILHQLNTYYKRQQSGPDATFRLAFADLNKHRSFVKRFEFKSIPSILVFPRGPNMDSSPISIAYWDNKTVSDYRREIDLILTHCDKISSLNDVLKDQISDFTNAVVEREVQELKYQKLQKMNQKNDIQINADGMTINTNSSFDNPLDNVKEKLEEMKNQTSLLLEDLQKEIDTALAILSVKTLKLNMLRTLLNDVETNGTAPLARRLNVERSRALKQAASIPLDLEMVGVTAEERLLSHASVSVVLDVFETLNS
jgi:hypothetical protein